ncbi:MAG: GNAT family N-acetyltransferase [Candidatus Nanopelagicales bacterium]
MAADPAPAPASPLPPRRDLSDGVVLLRAPRHEDAEAILDGASDPVTVRWTRVPSPYSLEMAHEFVDTIASGWTEGTTCIWAVCDAAEPDELLGVIGLHGVDLSGDPGGIAEVGYWMRAAGRRRGLMTRAMRVVSTFGVDELGLTRIDWVATVGNDASRRIAEANGYVVEGLLRRKEAPRGVREDIWIGGLLAEDLPRP